MSSDDLHRPLGMEPTAQPAARRRPVGAVLAGVLVAVAAGVSGWLVMTGDPMGGEPYAVASIDKTPQTGSIGQPAEAKPAQAEKPRETAGELEDSAGVKVIRGKNGLAPGAVVIRVPDAPPQGRLAEIDKRLSERGKHGPLPKVSPEGGKPREVYARPFEPSRAGGKPLIAVVVTGMGLGATVTGEAITRLPPEVSLAFAPYGNDLDRQTARAREAGHEVLLQAPMEPFVASEGDTGPQTLMAEAPEGMNRDRLHWLMSRFQGYVGVTNFMGGKFTGTRGALRPVLEEIGQRGLLYLDDGSSGRSLVSEIAGSIGLPAARGDVVLDGLTKPGDLDAALAKAEAQARANGKAVVVGAALPATIDRISRWARTLEQKGFALAPVSAVVQGRRG